MPVFVDRTGRDDGHNRIEGVEQTEVSLRPHSDQLPQQPGLIAVLRALNETFRYRFTHQLRRSLV